jgi:hypothetical protein
MNIGEALANVLERAAAAQPEQFAGYVANLDFWLEEYEHLVRVKEGFEARNEKMRVAFEAYATEHGGPHNRDDTGGWHQGFHPTTAKQDRNGMIVRNRLALARIIRRALKLSIIDFPRHDDLLERIGEA